MSISSSLPPVKKAWLSSELNEAKTPKSYHSRTLPRTEERIRILMSFRGGAPPSPSDAGTSAPPELLLPPPLSSRALSLSSSFPTVVAACTSTFTDDEEGSRAPTSGTSFASSRSTLSMDLSDAPSSFAGGAMVTFFLVGWDRIVTAGRRGGGTTESKKNCCGFRGCCASSRPQGGRATTLTKV